MKYLLNGLALIFLFMITDSCRTAQKQMSTGTSAPGPELIVYKTRKDYSKNVPVILNADRTAVESYPGIRDIYYQGQLAYPTQLEQGYLLDNRGINTGVAFLKITYEAYAVLSATPSSSELYKMIEDKDPLLEMYSGGNRSRWTDPVAELNALIRTGSLDRLTRLK
ncbi:MAG: hypothetical protein EOM90_04530 [Alphaproteobacteria bacterium]|nr:hypothetical protein [Alphaproteobacteria bacterium]